MIPKYAVNIQLFDDSNCFPFCDDLAPPSFFTPWGSPCGCAYVMPLLAPISDDENIKLKSNHIQIGLEH